MIMIMIMITCRTEIGGSIWFQSEVAQLPAMQ